MATWPVLRHWTTQLWEEVGRGLWQCWGLLKGCQWTPGVAFIGGFTPCRVSPGYLSSVPLSGDSEGGRVGGVTWASSQHCCIKLEGRFDHTQGNGSALGCPLMCGCIPSLRLGSVLGEPVLGQSLPSVDHVKSQAATVWGICLPSRHIHGPQGHSQAPSPSPSHSLSFSPLSLPLPLHLALFCTSMPVPPTDIFLL